MTTSRTQLRPVSWSSFRGELFGDPLDGPIVAITKDVEKLVKNRIQDCHTSGILARVTKLPEIRNEWE